MTAQPPDPAPSPLESRYRTLLACYPRDHRQAHEEEMLGVLLDTAHPEQTRPGVRDTVDLIGGAARCHLRRIVGSGSAVTAWQRAFPVAAAVGSLVILLYLGAEAFFFGLFGARQLMAGLALAGSTVVLTTLDLRFPSGTLRALTTMSSWATAAVLVAGPVLLAEPPSAWLATGLLNHTWLYLLAIGTALASTLATVSAGGSTRRPTSLPIRPLVLWSGLAALAMVPATPMVSIGFGRTGHVTGLFLGVPFAIVAAVAAGYALRSPIGVRVLLLFTPALLAYVGTGAYYGTQSADPFQGFLVVTVPVIILAVLAGRARRSRPELPAPTMV